MGMPSRLVVGLVVGEAGEEYGAATHHVKARAIYRRNHALVIMPYSE
jgi:hypothetical protein